MTLLELLVTVTVIAVISSMAITPVFKEIPKWNAKESALIVKQALNIAQSKAMKTSQTVIVNFSGATSSVDGKGALIEIKDNNLNVISSYYLNQNVLYNPSISTIPDTEFRFNYMGEPVDSSGDINGIDEANNKIGISSYSSSSAKYSYTLTIAPITGLVSID